MFTVGARARLLWCIDLIAERPQGAMAVVSSFSFENTRSQSIGWSITHPMPVPVAHTLSLGCSLIFGFSPMISQSLQMSLPSLHSLSSSGNSRLHWGQRLVNGRAFASATIWISFFSLIVIRSPDCLLALWSIYDITLRNDRFDYSRAAPPRSFLTHTLSRDNIPVNLFPRYLIFSFSE